MGIEYSAAIIVGLPIDELREHENFDDFKNGDLDSAPPFYDGGRRAIMGVVVTQSGDYCAREIDTGLDQRIALAKESFKSSTGMDGKVYITPVGY